MCLILGLESFCFRKGEVGCGFLEGGGGLEIGHAGETDVADVTGDDKGLGVVFGGKGSLL